MKELSQHEEHIMQLFWRLKRAVVREILDLLPEPKPPYTTLASSIRLLESKGYLDHQTFGKVNQYFPIVTQEAYRKNTAHRVLTNYFDGSVGNFLSFMVKENKVSDKEIEELQRLIDQYEKGERS
ncbi:BlaI/MecI/CopY family transcriptional regulator [Algoriphagus namhaensis]